MSMAPKWFKDIFAIKPVALSKAIKRVSESDVLTLTREGSWEKPSCRVETEASPSHHGSICDKQHLPVPTSPDPRLLLSQVQSVLPMGHDCTIKPPSEIQNTQIFNRIPRVLFLVLKERYFNPRNDDRHIGALWLHSCGWYARNKNLSHKQCEDTHPQNQRMIITTITIFITSATKFIKFGALEQ